MAYVLCYFFCSKKRQICEQNDNMNPLIRTPGASMKKQKKATNLKMEIRAKSDRILCNVGVIKSKSNEVSGKQSPHWQIFQNAVNYT